MENFGISVLTISFAVWAGPSPPELSSTMSHLVARSLSRYDSVLYLVSRLGPRLWSTVYHPDDPFGVRLRREGPQSLGCVEAGFKPAAVLNERWCFVFDGDVMEAGRRGV